jgi:hypothetical protein
MLLFPSLVFFLYVVPSVQWYIVCVVIVVSNCYLGAFISRMVQSKFFWIHVMTLSIKEIRNKEMHIRSMKMEDIIHWDSVHLY